MDTTAQYVYGYSISLADLAPSYHPNSTYVQFIDPDTNILTTLYGDETSPNYYEGDSYITSKFRVYLSSDNTGLGESLLVISCLDGVYFNDYVFTLGLSDVAYQSQYSDSFKVSCVGSVPSQKISPAPISLSTKSSILTIPLSDYYFPVSFNAVNLTSGTSSIKTSLNGYSSSFIINGTEFILQPNYQSSVTSPYGDINLIIKTSSASSVSSGTLVLDYFLNGSMYPYKNGFGSYAGYIYSPFNSSSNNVFTSSLIVPYEIYLSNESSTEYSSPSSQSGLFGSATDLILGLFPSSSSLSTSQKLGYVLVTILISFFVLLVAVFSATRSLPQGVFYVGFIIAIFEFFFFIGLGYVNVGLLIVVVLIILLLLFLLRRGG